MKNIIIIVAWLVAFLWTGYAMADFESERYYVESEAPVFPTTTGPTYYVDQATGDDANTGLSFGQAWKTFGKAMVWGGPPSGNERFKDGLGGIIVVYPGIYRERVSTPTGSSNDWTDGGSEARRTWIVGSGTGEVILDSGCTADSWSEATDNNGLGGGVTFYKSVISAFVGDGGNPSDITAVVIDEDMYSYHFVTDYADMTDEGDWYWDAAGTEGDLAANTMYLYPLSAKGNPSDDDVVIVERASDSSTKFGFNVQAQGATPNRYITIQDITIRGSQSHGMEIGIAKALGHVNVMHCKIYANAKSGINSSLTNNCILRKNDIFFNIIRNWPRGRWNLTCSSISAGGWPQALGGPTNSYQTVNGNLIHDNGGEGIGGGKGDGTHICYDNIVYDNWSVGIYYDNNPDNIIRNNYVYVGRDFTTADVGDHCVDGFGADSCAAGSCMNAVLTRCRMIGISTADEDYGTGANAANNSIYNNLIVNCREGINHFREATGSGVKNAKVYSNTIIVPNADPAGRGGSFAGISYTQDSNDTNSFVYNNVIYSQHEDNYCVRQNIDTANESGVQFDYNIYYAPDAVGGIAFSLGGADKTFADWKTDASEDPNSTLEDPDLQDITDATDADGFRPNVASVSLEDGTTLGSPYNEDFNYTVRPDGAEYARGAFETSTSSYSSPSVITGVSPTNFFGTFQ